MMLHTHSGPVRRPLDLLGRASGLLAAAVFLALYTTAMALDPGYGFYRNYLSDLGVGPGAWAFNSAVVVAGALMVVFALLGLGPAVERGLAHWTRPLLRTALAWASPSLLAIGGAFLVLIGVFTEDAGDIHGVVSIGFFTFAYIALVVLSAVQRRSRALGTVGWLATIVAAAIGTVILPFGFNPQTETVAVLAVVAWGITASGILLVGAWPRTS
jgi:hypothetical membrane protein